MRPPTIPAAYGPLVQQRGVHANREIVDAESPRCPTFEVRERAERARGRAFDVAQQRLGELLSPSRPHGPSISTMGRWSVFCSRRLRRRRRRAHVPRRVGRTSTRKCGARASLWRCCGRHRFGDVLQLRRTEIGDGEIEATLDLPIGLFREADRARFGDTFQPRRDIEGLPQDWGSGGVRHRCG
jgi:hypothetical protein